jgi:hypothetical protein
MFQLFQSYVAICVFMLQVASVLSAYCICFTHMLQVYVPNVLSASDVYVAFKCFVFQIHVHRVIGARTGCQGKGAASQGGGR